MRLKPGERLEHVDESTCGRINMWRIKGTCRNREQNILPLMTTYLRHWLPTLCIAALLSSSALAADHKPPPVGNVTDYAASDTHANEQVTVAAEPFDKPEKAKFFRVSYLEYGFLPVRVIITNNSDKPINLTDARIQFISAAGDTIPAALPEEVERAIDKPKNPAAPGVKLPFPLPNVHGRSGDKSKQINEDFDALGFQAFAVEAHSTQSGFLFYDINGLDRPFLKGAQLYLKRLHNAEGKELFNFTIPFDKYLSASQSCAPAK